MQKSVKMMSKTSSTSTLPVIFPKDLIAVLSSSEAMAVSFRRRPNQTVTKVEEKGRVSNQESF
jgi:hypothetical protein